MIPLDTTKPDKEQNIWDLVNRKLSKDMAEHPGVNLTLGRTSAREPMQDVPDITWKVEAGTQTAGRRPRLKYLGRFRDVENSQDLSGLWFDMHTKPYKFWLKRMHDQVKPEK